MADQAEGPAGATQAAPVEAPAGQAEPTLAGLDAKVDRLAELVREFIGGTADTSASSEPEPQTDIRAEVRKAVREVQAADRKKADAEAAEAEQKSLAEQVKTLTAQVEKPPREFRRATRRMGWVLESEQ